MEKIFLEDVISQTNLKLILFYRLSEKFNEKKFKVLE